MNCDFTPARSSLSRTFFAVNSRPFPRLVHPQAAVLLTPTDQRLRKPPIVFAASSYDCPWLIKTSVSRSFAITSLTPCFLAPAIVLPPQRFSP